MAKLRIYTVHVNPSLPHPYESAEFIPEGFNFRAFVFSSLWALYQRLWWQSVMLIVYNFVMLEMMDSKTLTYFGICIIDIGVRLLVAFQANEWLRARLKKRGYLTTDVTTGDSPLRAEQRFFDRYFAAHPNAAV